MNELIDILRDNDCSIMFDSSLSVKNSPHQFTAKIISVSKGSSTLSLNKTNKPPKTMEDVKFIIPDEYKNGTNGTEEDFNDYYTDLPIQIEKKYYLKYLKYKAKYNNLKINNKY